LKIADFRLQSVRILVAPDKFKGSLNAREVAESVATGIRNICPGANIRALPIADGGEGTAEAICAARNGEWVRCSAHDALGRPIEVEYGWLADGSTAVMEMSAAAGLWRIGPEQRDLLRATTFGVGEMIRHAADRGAKEILLGLGGSATNDGGIGAARALGFRFLNDDREIKTPGELLNLKRIAPPANPVRAKISAAVDVRNPLLGPRGATRTFGRQKGGMPEQLDLLEKGLTRLADVVRDDLSSDYREHPGAGAAGGLGFGLMSFCHATVKPGFDVVAEFIGLKSAIEEADVVITGEGRLDSQTLEGKAPAGVAQLARAAGKRVFAIAGSSDDSASVRDLFDAVFVLARGGITAEESIARARELLEERAREFARMMVE
jgi:glycerate kinase